MGTGARRGARRGARTMATWTGTARTRAESACCAGWRPTSALGLGGHPDGYSPVMTRVLIAADDSELAVEAASSAHHLFGDDAVYFVINVAPSQPVPTMAWGYAYPVVMPMVAYPPPVAGDGEPATSDDAARDGAEQRAALVADDASLGTGARPLADVGDPATAIIDAARDQLVDVIVVGSHDRSWLSRLFSGSVVNDVVRDAPVPVLVVK